MSLNVGFYYMANAMESLMETVLSGLVFQPTGLAACLWVSAAFLAPTTLILHWLPRHTESVAE